MKMYDPAEPQPTTTSGCLWVLLTVVGVGMLLLVGTCTAIFVVSGNSEVQDQKARRDAAERLLGPCTKVRLWNDRGAYTATLGDEEARLFGSITQKTLAIEADTGSSLNTYNKGVTLELTCADGSTIQLTHDCSFPAAYCIEAIDTWYFKSPPQAFLVALVWVTLALEAGIDPHSFSPSASTVRSMYTKVARPDWPKWDGLSDQECAFISTWFKRFNAVSGEAPLDDSRLLPAK